MFLVYNLNIITYRHDSFLFNYHATIINQQFNHHFSRFTRNRYTPKVLKTECFQESISLFCRNTLLFCKKDVRFFSSKCPYQGHLHLHLSGLETRVCRRLTPGSRQKKITILLKICYMLHVKKLLFS